MSRYTKQLILLEDATVRFEQVFWLGGVLTDLTALPYDFREALSAEWESILSPFNDATDYLGFDEDDNDAFAEWLFNSRRFGFLVKVATPIMQPLTKVTLYSWEHCATQWLYAETIQEATQQATVWAQTQRLQEKAKANG